MITARGVPGLQLASWRPGKAMGAGPGPSVSLKAGDDQHPSEDRQRERSLPPSSFLFCGGLHLTKRGPLTGERQTLPQG